MLAKQLLYNLSTVDISTGLNDLQKIKTPAGNLMGIHNTTMTPISLSRGHSLRLYLKLEIFLQHFLSVTWIFLFSSCTPLTAKHTVWGSYEVSLCPAYPCTACSSCSWLISHCKDIFVQVSCDDQSVQHPFSIFMDRLTQVGIW